MKIRSKEDFDKMESLIKKQCQIHSLQELCKSWGFDDCALFYDFLELARLGFDERSKSYSTNSEQDVKDDSPICNNCKYSFCVKQNDVIRCEIDGCLHDAMETCDQFTKWDAY